MKHSGDNGRVSGGLYKGLQASAAITLEKGWAHTARDQEIE